jgi:hypothetical protein
VAADFNEDGKLDLATSTYILLGNGDGTFQSPAVNFGGTAEVLATGDFNGDGRPDLVAQVNQDMATILLQQLPTAPGAKVSPSSLNFRVQALGTSATMPVTLTNSGTAPLTITSIGFTGPNAGEFRLTNPCSSSLAVGAGCTINVTFTPAAAESATASLSIVDNAAGGPQTVAITGTSQSILTTTCTSLSVVPGQTAIFAVDLAPVGQFAPPASLSCSGAPALATCTVSPSTVTPTGSTPVEAQVTVTTTRATGFLQPPFGRSDQTRVAGLVGFAGLAGFAALVVLPGTRRGKAGRRLLGFIWLWCVLGSLALLPSCGGGGGADPPGTVAGTYPLTVTASFQSAGTTATEKVSFNLVVQ